MAPPKKSPTSSTSSRSKSVTQLALGMLIGATLTLFCVGPTFEVGTAATITTASTATVTTAVNNNEMDGWQNIHVYYGEQSALFEQQKQKQQELPQEQQEQLPVLDSNQQWFAQVHQDEIVFDLIGPNGYFIDLAANEAAILSNTLALERHGWKGLCIEPNPAYWYGLSHRQCTVVGALIGGSKEKVQVKFRGVYGGIVGKHSDKFADNNKEPDTLPENRYTAPLRELLEKFNVPRSIDYLSLDVEGAEMLIMENFPFDTYTIKILTVERPGDDLEALLQSKGYIFLKRLVQWGETLWAHESTGFSPDHPKIQAIRTE